MTLQKVSLPLLTGEASDILKPRTQVNSRYDLNLRVKGNSLTLRLSKAASPGLVGVAGNMRSLLILLISLIACGCKSTPSVTQYFSIGDPVDYCGEEFFLAWSSHPAENYYIQEYLPEGENVEHYNKMFSVSVLFGEGTAEEAVLSKVAELEQRKETDSFTNYGVSQNEGDYFLDFIVSGSTADRTPIVELNLHRYRQMRIDGRNAIVLYIYSCRSYGNNIPYFMESVSSDYETSYKVMCDLRLTPVFPTEGL